MARGIKKYTLMIDDPATGNFVAVPGQVPPLADAAQDWLEENRSSVPEEIFSFRVDRTVYVFTNESRCAAEMKRCGLAVGVVEDAA